MYTDHKSWIWLLFCFSLTLLSGCNGNQTRPSDLVPPGPSVVVRTVTCDQSSPIRPPVLESLLFVPLVDPATSQAYICLSPTDHTVFQTNHIRLIGYVEELQAYSSYLYECIRRHNQQAAKDSAAVPIPEKP